MLLRVPCDAVGLCSGAKRSRNGQENETNGAGAVFCPILLERRRGGQEV